MIMNIPQCNPKANYLVHKDGIDRAIAQVLESGRYILGLNVEGFEKEFAEYIGVRFAVSVGSGTDALVIALRAMEIGKGHEVITVSHTAVATVAAIELCGATPVLVDIDPRTYTLDPGRLEKAVTGKTRAIIPVHLYGQPAALEAILDIAKRHEISVLEDCAQAHGAYFGKKRVGAWGSMGAFSFYPTKNLGALGDGGMIVTNDPVLAENARLHREYGWKERYISSLPGTNSRIDELQAAILRVKLLALDQENEARQKLAGVYEYVLRGTDIVVPAQPNASTHVYHQYVIRVPGRDALQKYLKSQGIGTLVHYPVPVHLQPAYLRRVRCAGTMTHSAEAARNVLSLPMFPELTIAEATNAAECVVTWLKNRR
jgi:dTDP-4-amino-4,6-dideoxygalactose transaminase